MKKIIFSILMIVFITSISFAGPFGLSKGMSLDEVSKNSEKGYEPTSVANNDRYIFVPKKKHDLFEVYVAFIDKENGLYGIRARSEKIKTSDYGTELKNAFDVMVTRLSKIYGQPKIIDKIKHDYHLKEEKYWLYAVRDGARELSATWSEGDKYTNLPDELERVSIYVSAEFSSGFVIIEYEFSNYSEIQEKQDDVL